MSVMSKDDALIATSQLTLAAALVLFLLYFFAPTFFGIHTLLASIFLIVIAVASFGLYTAIVSGVFGVSLLILSFAFLLSLSLGIGVISESWRLAIILEHNPNYHLSNIRNTFLLGIMPLAIALSFYAFSWIRQKIPRNRLVGVFVVTLGIFFIVWGVLHIQGTMKGYAIALSEIVAQELGYLDSSLLAIYATYGLYSTLWIVIGIFLSASSAHMLIHKKVNHTKNPC